MEGMMNLSQFNTKDFELLINYKNFQSISFQNYPIAILDQLAIDLPELKFLYCSEKHINMHCFDRGYILNDKGEKSNETYYIMYKLQTILAKVYSNPVYTDVEKEINDLRLTILQYHETLKDSHEKNQNQISENKSITEDKIDSEIKKSSKQYSDNTESVNSSKISEQNLISNSK